MHVLRSTRDMALPIDLCQCLLLPLCIASIARHSPQVLLRLARLVRDI
jgi:hypothetical protein